MLANSGRYYVYREAEDVLRTPESSHVVRVLRVNDSVAQRHCKFNLQV